MTNTVRLVEGAETVARLSRNLPASSPYADLWPGAPFVFAEAGEEVFAGLSLAAPIDADLASDLEPALPEALSKARQRDGTVLKVPDRLRLEENKEIVWVDYLRIEDGLIQILLTETGTPVDRLVAAEVYLVLLSRYLEAKRAVDDPALRIKTIFEFAEQMHQDRFRRAIEIGARTKPSPGIRRAVFALFDGATGMTTKGDRGPSKAALLTKTLIRAFRKGHPERGRRRLGPDQEREFLGYAVHLIRRKGLLLGASPYFTGVVRRGFAFTVVLLGEVLRRVDTLDPKTDPGTALAVATRETEIALLPLPTSSDKLHPQRALNDSHFWLQIFDRYAHGNNFAKSILST